MTTHLELQAAIDREIVNAMIMTTPENWQMIKLTLTRAGVDPLKNYVGAPLMLSAVDPYNGAELLHELSSPEGLPPVAPNEALYEATYKLDQHLKNRGAHLAKAVYTAKSDGKGWNYSIKFEY